MGTSQADIQKVAVVTGSPVGIGFETSLAFARNGFHTYATVRKLEDGGSKQIIDIARNGKSSITSYSTRC